MVLKSFLAIKNLVANMGAIAICLVASAMLIMSSIPASVNANASTDQSKYVIKGRPLNFAEEITLKKIEKFLASFETYQARFSQSNPGGGSISEGYFYIKRPGMARLDYLQPTEATMVVKGEKVKYHDKRLDQVSYVNAGGHPFLPLLYKSKIISDKIHLQNIYEDEKQIIINFTALSDAVADDNATNLEKIFIRFLKNAEGNKIASIRNIERSDANGATTSIYLFDIQEDVEISDEHFSLSNPTAFKKR